MEIVTLDGPLKMIVKIRDEDRQAQRTAIVKTSKVCSTSAAEKILNIIFTKYPRAFLFFANNKNYPQSPGIPQPKPKRYLIWKRCLGNVAEMRRLIAERMPRRYLKLWLATKFLDSFTFNTYLNIFSKRKINKSASQKFKGSLTI